MKSEEELIKNQKKNEEYLNLFKKHLEESNLSIKTINKHISNIGLFLNDYLNDYECKTIEDGCSSLNSFFKYWYIRKCLFASQTGLKSLTSSVKMFYKFMMEQNLITKEGYDLLAYYIKECYEEWLEELNRYDDPNISDDEFFGIF
ncbi:MAG: recombinase [Bacilli bacterium]